MNAEERKHVNHAQALLFLGAHDQRGGGGEGGGILQKGSDECIGSTLAKPVCKQGEGLVAKAALDGGQQLPVFAVPANGIDQ